MIGMRVKFKKHHDSAVLPEYAHKNGDVGLDLTAVSREFNKEFGFWEYDTGISIQLPPGFFAYIAPRSSISKYDLMLCNAMGVIDPSYTGTIKLRFKNLEKAVKGRNYQEYQVGDKIGQLIITQYIPIKPEFTLDVIKTERGDGGFGSTTKKG